MYMEGNSSTERPMKPGITTSCETPAFFIDTFSQVLVQTAAVCQRRPEDTRISAGQGAFRDILPHLCMYDLHSYVWYNHLHLQREWCRL